MANTLDCSSSQGRQGMDIQDALERWRAVCGSSSAYGPLWLLFDMLLGFFLGQTAVQKSVEIDVFH